MMTAGWESWKLAHAYHRIGSGTTPTVGNAGYYDSELGTPWITTSELRETYIDKTSANITDSAINDFSALRVYAPNSVFMAMYGATIGRLGMSTVAATCNQACCVFESSKQFENRFLFYWLWHRRDQLISLSVGGGQPNLSQQDLKSEKALCPPLQTQKRIAAFLDEKTARIDALIEKKRALLDRLAEKRQAIITQAVTKGLNPAAPMKDSGIDWLGQIPEHWETKPLKRVKRFLTSGSRGWGEYYADAGDMFLRMTNVTKGGIEIDLADLRFVQITGVTEGIRTATQLGDILITITAELGSVAIVRDAHVGAYINQHLALFRVDKSQCDPDFLVNFLWSNATRAQFELAGQGGTKQGLGFEQVDNILVACPPYHEQGLIAQSVTRARRFLDKLEKSISESISRLVEYRSALITSAVTGQFPI